ncbi:MULTISPECIES: glutaredoxin family protein [Enorma]|uniref:glutaredoxin family protein n=1 Tax=Enorma TaxID=1472762 RepID=UPI000349B7BF|nr:MULTISPECIES: glutaredoxin [Enorma]
MATTYELYIMPTCPYCRKVLLYMSQHDIELPLRDITADTEARATLERVGGKAQVPCLFIDGAPMYESDDIIAYLGKEFADGAAPSVSPEEQAELDNGAACPIF